MYILENDIRRLIAHYTQKCDSRDPFQIAEYLNIETQIGALGSRCGCYMFLKNHRCIFLNENLSRNDLRLVMAHELGHAIMHQRENCYFIRNKTLLLNSKNEIEANTFAAELLIPDEILLENHYLTVGQLSRLLGYEQSFIELRLKSYMTIY